jgi:hypothetical protein
MAQKAATNMLLKDSFILGLSTFKMGHHNRLTSFSKEVISMRQPNEC